MQSQKMLKYCRYNFGVRMLTHQQLDSMGHKNIYYYKKSEKKNRKQKKSTLDIVPSIPRPEVELMIISLCVLIGTLAFIV